VIDATRKRGVLSVQDIKQNIERQVPVISYDLCKVADLLLG
jgi:hypothetical protein